MTLLECHLGDQLIGHILEQNCQHHARSWPAEVPIGIYASRAEALAAIAHAAELYSLEDGADRELTVQPCQMPMDLDKVIAQMLEIIDHRRSTETFALFRYLQDRGFHPDNYLLLIEDALEKYADEQP
ncbi:hypothetical protein [Microvirga sp. KLBC 81]|uniref:hypothetical protein n=1 Tax=Microvirga sp. KLBC 81 TaxID=1862707 RepID=UPI00105808C3|nr:hypothetical protein [Microvirga sp. KLBC 81]